MEGEVGMLLHELVLRLMDIEGDRLILEGIEVGFHIYIQGRPGVRGRKLKIVISYAFFGGIDIVDFLIFQIMHVDEFPDVTNGLADLGAQGLVVIVRHILKKVPKLVLVFSYSLEFLGGQVFHDVLDYGKVLANLVDILAPELLSEFYALLFVFI